MRLQQDCYFTIGRAHTVCEDYTVQGDEPFPHLLLCDGCSGSEHSDIGARVLAMSARHALSISCELPNYQVFGEQVIHNAQHVIDSLNITDQALDATLMMALVHGDSVHVYVYGDGAVLFRNKLGQIGCIEIEFTHNAPFYLSYWPDKARTQAYAHYGQSPLIVRDSRNLHSEPLNFRTPLMFTFPLSAYQMVAIASDGIAQFVDSTRGAYLPTLQAAEALLNFRSFEGEFVKRRIKHVLDNYARQDIYPVDDLSIGVFQQIIHSG